MYKVIFHITFFITICFLLGTSCKKEKGCTDNTAQNYNIDAEVDDQSCVFPSLNDNVTGNWTMSWTKSESKDSSGNVLISIDESKLGTAEFNPDGSGTYNADSILVFYWATIDGKVNVIIDTIAYLFIVKTNSATRQEWSFDSASVVNDISYQLSIDINLEK